MNTERKTIGEKLWSALLFYRGGAAWHVAPDLTARELVEYWRTRFEPIEDEA